MKLKSVLVCKRFGGGKIKAVGIFVPRDISMPSIPAFLQSLKVSAFMQDLPRDFPSFIDSSDKNYC